jgi:hypothetical protein
MSANASQTAVQKRPRDAARLPSGSGSAGADPEMADCRIGSLIV